MTYRLGNWFGGVVAWLRKGLWRHLFRGRHGKRGGVTMEYVILGVLVAAAAVLPVAVFGRSIATMFFAAGEGVTLQHTKAKTDLDMRRGDIDKGMKVAREYHDAMHE